MSDIITRILDEHSMNGRPTWAWIEQRHSQHRRTHDVLDKNGNVVEFDVHSSHSTTVLSRRMGGIPMVISFGDHAQLPCMGMKSVHDPRPGTPGKACASGQIAFQKFRHPPLENDVVIIRSTSVFLDKVLRQDEPAL